MTTWTPATEQSELWSTNDPEAGHAFDGLFADSFSDDAFDVGQFWEPWTPSTAETETWTAPTEQAETWTAVTKQPEGWS